MNGLCECGCGERTNLANCTCVSKGWVKGQPMRFVLYHRNRLPKPRSNHLERFMQKFEVRDDGCWQWIRLPTGKARYVHFVGVPAHRWSYQHFVGPVPEGLELDHLCRNTFCVNPDHLEAVTHAENVRRGEGPPAANARKTHCPRGHEFTPDNTYAAVAGKGRRCKTCHLQKALARRQRLKGAA